MSYQIQRGAGHSSGGGHCGKEQTAFANWKEKIEFENLRRRSPYVMQSNMDFTLTGSVSANCHGWQHSAPPIGATIKEISIDGVTYKGPQELEKPEVRAVIGGWGLCGEIDYVNFYDRPNYKVESFTGTGWAELVLDNDFHGTDLLNIHLDSSWRKAIVNQHFELKNEPAVVGKLKDYVNPLVPLMVKHAPKLRWFAQRNAGLHRVSSRNELLYTSVKHFSWPGQELMEFFVPVGLAGCFAKEGRKYVQQMQVFNTTVRHVEQDRVSLLPYAAQAVRGFVMLVEKQDSNARCFRSLLDLAVDLGGSYYLPYNQYATKMQFRRAYPSWGRFANYVKVQSEWAKKYLAD